MPRKRVRAVKYTLNNYQCGKCETGVVQIHQSINRSHQVTTVISGCLDCGHDYGLHHGAMLKELPKETVLNWM